MNTPPSILVSSRDLSCIDKEQTGASAGTNHFMDLRTAFSRNKKKSNIKNGCLKPATNVDFLDNLTANSCKGKQIRDKIIPTIFPCWLSFLWNLSTKTAF